MWNEKKIYLSSVKTPIRDELQKKLLVQFAWGIKDEFYEVSKSPKGRLSYTLKSEMVKEMKLAKDEISIVNKLSANYLSDNLINFQKRWVATIWNKKVSEDINKLINDLYDPSLERNVNEETSIKSKLQEAIEEPTSLESTIPHKN
jgi:NAD-specific glutamate dehydrogenase